MKLRWLIAFPVAILLVLQAFPIDQQLPEGNPDVSLEQVLRPPAEVADLLKNACYDCHSNQTRYPWYARIQPVGWWIQRHTRSGRAELNFSTMGQWNSAEQADMFRHCIKLIKRGTMPLQSYLRMHPEAHWTARQQASLLAWLEEQSSRLESGDVKLVAQYQQIMPSDTCDDNDANPRCCFVQMPENPQPVLVIAPPGEPGRRIKISGRFFKSDGKTPYSNVLIYAYQTDTTGRYTRNGDERGILRWHGRLHAWGRTDELGRYEIQTIRPAAYPGGKNPAHIHTVVWEPGAGEEPYYIKDFLFADDPALSNREREDAHRNPGRSAVLTLKSAGTDILVAKRDIILK
ncbi:MAG: heme-binding domain-containing protein [Saprospiraceae bacterium]|nr:heme-binding domain-containing protein [Lewinellaceae bacterium]